MALPVYQRRGIMYADLPRVETASLKEGARGFESIDRKLDQLSSFIQREGTAQAKEQALAYAALAVQAASASGATRCLRVRQPPRSRISSRMLRTGGCCRGSSWEAHPILARPRAILSTLTPYAPTRRIRLTPSATSSSSAWAMPPPTP